MNCTIRFPDEGISVVLTSGATLLDAQIAAGFSVDAPCGGTGACGKCAVECRRPGEEEYTRVLACQTRVFGDLEVRRLSRDDGIRVMLEGAGAEPAVRDPMVRAVKLRVRPCPKGESVSDWARLCEALDGALGRRDWQPSIPVCHGLSGLLHQTGGEIWAVVTGNHILEELYCLFQSLGANFFIWMISVQSSYCLSRISYCLAGLIITHYINNATVKRESTRTIGQQCYLFTLVSANES